MSQAKKNRRLCETLKLYGDCKNGRDYTLIKEKPAKVKTKSKKAPQGTFSMIKFYQSIPNYDEIRHLPEYDFSERVDLLKKIHCDLSGTMIHNSSKWPVSSGSRCSKRKTSAKKKKGSTTLKSTISPSLCNSFSKASLVEMSEISNGVKQIPVDRLPSGHSFISSSPMPAKHLQAYRERLLSYVDDWKCEAKCPSPKMPSPLCSSYSPQHSMKCNNLSFKPQEVHQLHSAHDFESHPCEIFNHNFDNEICFQNSPKPFSLINPKYEVKHRAYDEKCSKMKKNDEKCMKKMRRAKSCPKDLFSLSSKCSEMEKNMTESPDTQCIRRLCRDDSTPCYNNGYDSYRVSEHHKEIPKIRVEKPKSKTPNSMDEFVASKLVRSNHAAKLRHSNSRKKLSDLAEEKLKETMHVSKFIPKCHHWDVRNTPGWKTFATEDTTTEKLIREENRREEQRVRKHANAMAMNIMRSRVKSAQLLLEGRSLSAK